MNAEITNLIKAFKILNNHGEDISDICNQSNTFDKFLGDFESTYDGTAYDGACILKEHYNIFFGGDCTSDSADDYDLGWADTDLLLVDNADKLNDNGLYSLDFSQPTDWDETENCADVPRFNAKPASKSALLKAIFGMFLNTKSFTKYHAFDGIRMSYDEINQMFNALNGSHIIGHSVKTTVAILGNTLRGKQLTNQYNNLEKRMKSIKDSLAQISVNNQELYRTATKFNSANKAHAKHQKYVDMKTRGQNMIKKANRILKNPLNH